MFGAPRRVAPSIVRRGRNSFLFLLLCVVQLVASATTLEDAVRRALATNPQVTGVEATHRAARHDLKQARGGYLPSLDLDMRFGEEHSNIKQLSRLNNDDNLWRREIGVTVSQMIWDGFAVRSEVERRVALLNGAESSVADTRNAIAFKGVQTYFDVLQSRELKTLAARNVQSHEVVLANVEAKATSGVGNKADVEQARARLALAHSTVVARDQALREAEARYRRVIGDWPDDGAKPTVQASGLVRNGEVEREQLANATVQAEELAVAAHPAVLRSKADVEAAVAAVSGARAGYYPRVDLVGALRRDADLGGVRGNRNSESVMVVARWNLFRGGADREEEFAGVERKAAADEQLKETIMSVIENVEIAMASLATSEARLVYLEKHVGSSASALESYRAQFEIDRRTLIDLLNAEGELFNARANFVTGTYEYLTNIYFVEASKGALATSFDDHSLLRSRE